MGNNLDVRGGLTVSGSARVSGGLGADLFTGNGAGLTGLNAGNITSGTLPNAQLPANVAKIDASQTFSGANTFSYVSGAPFAVNSTTKVSNLNADLLDGLHSGAFAQLNTSPSFTGTVTAPGFSGNGSSLTSLNAANIASGTLADARLSANVATLNGTNVFTGTNTFAGVTILTNWSNVYNGTFSGNGGGLTNLQGANANLALLNGTNLFTGTNTFAGVTMLTNWNNVVNGTFAGNGFGLTNLNFTNLVGTIPDARLSTNVALLNGTNLFRGTNTFSGVVIATNLNNQLAGAFLNLPATTPSAGIIYSGGNPVLHAYGFENIFLGGAGNFTMNGLANTGIGFAALWQNNGGSYNVANGYGALVYNTSGSYNTADGLQALRANMSGNNNTAIGANTLLSNTTGSTNIALGFNAGYNITTGSSNIDIGNLGVSTDANIIRIGDGQIQAFIAGVITGNGFGLTNLNAGNIASGTLADARLSANVAMLNVAQTFTATNTFATKVGIGTLTPSAPLDVAGDTWVRGLLRSGSEAGTSEAPSPAGLVIRRINSNSTTAGQILARTDALTLERDGTTSGLLIRYPASGSSFTISCVGFNNAGTVVTFHRALVTPFIPSTVQIFSDAQRVVHAQISFGDTISSTGHFTQVVLDRLDDGGAYNNDARWVGTLNSTYNQ